MPDPRKGEHHASRARDMLRQGRLVEAERELRAAVASDPSRGDWMLNLGWTLEASGRVEQALEQYRQAAALLPQARDPRLAEGLALAKLARHAEAATAFEGVLKIDPRCETAVSMMIRSLALVGRHDEAETAYYLALHSIDRPATSHLEIARSLLARGDLPRAEHCFRRAIAEGPGLVGVRVELARLLVLADRAEETGPLVAGEFRLGTVPPPVALEAARIHLAAGRSAEAAQVLEQVARAEPSNPRLHLMLSRCLRRRNDLARATRHAEIAARLAADLPGLAFEAALVGLARTAPSGAERAPAALEPLRAAVLKELAARGTPADRIDAIEAIGAMLELGLVAEARDALRKRFGSGTAPSDASSDARLLRDPAYLRVASRLALEDGDLRTGRALARRLLRLEPASVAALHNLALIAIRRDRLDAAAGWLARARAASPSDVGPRKLAAVLWTARIRSMLAKCVGKRGQRAAR